MMDVMVKTLDWTVPFNLSKDGVNFRLVHVGLNS